MSKHTPGPWLEASRYIVTDEYTICEMFSARTREERDANQRLIAAAPELLGLLRALMDTRHKHFIDNGIDGMHGWDEQAQAAIAKATGEDEV
jgi:hypothetical protein